MLGPEAEKLLNARLAKEILSEPSLKAGKQLLVTAGVALLLAVYQVHVPKYGEVDFDTPQGHAVLLGALGVMLVYLLVRFLVAALYDVTQWYATADWIAAHNWYGPLQEAKEVHNRLRQLIDETQPPLDEKRRQRAQQLLQHVDDVTAQCAEKWRVAKAQAKTLNGLLLAKLLVDLVTPAVAGTFALSKLLQSVPPFVAALFR